MNDILVHHSFNTSSHDHIQLLKTGLVTTT